MLTRLRERSNMTSARPGQRAPRVSALDFPSQCLAEFLRRVQRVDPHPAVLDLGILCGGNIAFLGARGCRVSVESLPIPGKAATVETSAAGPRGPRKVGESEHPAPRVPLSPLNYPPGSFSGVLAWDAIARMPYEEAIGFAETLRKLLLDGGVVLAYFPGPTVSSPSISGRYRIIDEESLMLEPAAARSLPGSHFQNREIYSLFSRFSVVRLAQLKTGTREVLVAKTRRTSKA